MPKSHYDWSNGPATLKQHSVAKHQLLEDYLKAYYETVTNSPYREELRLTIVDGFAGGGVYKHADTKEIKLGSPFICLEATQQAEKSINENRQKQLVFDIDYFFIEKEKNASDFLRKSLIERQYDLSDDSKIRLLQGDFNQYAEDIINHIKKKSPKSGRSIFILDQYGYSDVPMQLLAKIFNTLPNAEVILTFGVDALSTYLNDTKGRILLENIGLPNIFEGRSIDEIKSSETNWRAYIQSQLYPRIVQASCARFHTPFFIKTTNGHGDFWLLHLSQHHKARDVMTEVHWANKNHFIHYGGEGFNMFNIGYIAKADDRFMQQNTLGFEFDDRAEKLTMEQLQLDVPRQIYNTYDDGQLFEALFATVCNHTPATARQIREALSNLAKQNTLELINDGRLTRSSNQIKASTIIRPPRQRSLFK